MRQLTLAVDVDEVCADLLGEWFRRYNVKYNDNLTPDEATEWELWKIVKPECGKDIYSFLTPDIYDHVLPIAGARGAVYELLGMGHRVVYATACHGLGAAQAKQQWLLRWGFLTEQNLSRDFLPVTDKSLIRADILFDDRIDNVRGFHGTGVLVDRKHNQQHGWTYRIGALSLAPEFVRGYMKGSWTNIR